MSIIFLFLTVNNFLKNQNFNYTIL